MLYFSKIYYSGLAFLFLCLFIYLFIFVSRGITNFEIIFQGLVAWIWVMSTSLSAKKKEEKLLQIWQLIAVLFRTSPYVVTRQLNFAMKYFILGQHTGEYFYYGHRLTGDKASMTKLIKNRPRLACLTMAPLIVVQACKRSFLFGFQFINKERIMDVTGPVGVKV